jgi:predicted Zn finger-like uncharacterized protein
VPCESISLEHEEPDPGSIARFGLLRSLSRVSPSEYRLLVGRLTSPRAWFGRSGSEPTGSGWRYSMKTRTGGYTVTCPHCRTKFVIGGYSPGLIRCGSCGKAFNLR